MSTPQTFAIPETDVYRTTNGKQSFFFTEGTVIPMYLAIALGLEGAGYDATPVFDSEEQAAIEALIAEGSSGGAYPLGQFFGDSDYYDSSTAYPAEYATVVVEANHTYALPFVVFRPCELGAARVNVTASSAGTVTGALYSPLPTPGTFAGYPGDLIVESTSDTSTGTNGNKAIAFAAATFLDPGLYYIAVQFTGTPTVTSIVSTSAGRYLRNNTGAYNSSSTYGTFDDPFDNDDWGLFFGAMPLVEVTLKNTAV